MVKAQQGEISILKTENGRAVQALREMINGLKLQMDNIQSKNFTMGTEGGTLNQKVGFELVRLMADLEATMEVVKTDFTANFCSVQNLQQGTSLMGEENSNPPFGDSGFAAPNFSSAGRSPAP